MSNKITSYFQKSPTRMAPPPSPARYMKVSGWPGYGHGHWVLGKKQDCSEAVVGEPQPNKMRIKLTNLQNPDLDRELFYDRAMEKAFDWNDESDLSILNEWRQEKIRLHARRSLRIAHRTNPVKKQAVKEQFVRSKGTRRARSGGRGKAKDEDAEYQLPGMANYGEEVEALGVERRRSARLLDRQRPL